LDSKNIPLSRFSEEIKKLRQRVQELEDILTKHEKSALPPPEENTDEYEGLFDNTPDLVLILDSQGKFIYVNKIWRDALSYTEEDLVNLSFVDTLRFDHLEKWKELFQRLVHEETALHAHFVFKTKSGAEIAVEGDLNPVLKRGQLLRVNAVLRNLNEVRQMAWDREWYFNSSLDLLFITAFDGELKRLNPAFERTLGYYKNEVLGTSLLGLVVEEDLPLSRKELQKLKSGTPSIYFEARFRCKDGTVKWLAWTAHSVLSEELIYGVARDITDKKLLEDELRKLSFTDELTGLYNRRGFMTFSAKIMDLAYREGRGLLVALLDLDGLKEINDQFGHNIGDEALRKVSILLKKVFRGSDVIARLGGDEYAIAALVSDVKACERIKTRLQKLAEKENDEAGKAYRFSFSFGFHYWDPRQNLGIEQVLEKADQELYEDKKMRSSRPAIPSL